MEKGTLVEFRLHGDRRLGAIDRPEGKKHWIVIDESGQSQTIHPRQISYTVDGERYRPQDIAAFAREAIAYQDPENLEVAWEYLVEEGGSIEPPQLAELLFSDRTPAQCYACYCLLSEDKLYFKQKSNRYEPRNAEQVAELKHQKEVEAQKKVEREGFLERARQALADREKGAWAESDRPRIEMLEKYAAFGEESSNKGVKELLAELEYPETPEAAFRLLVDLGIWSPHENLFLRRSQIPIEFPKQVCDVANSYSHSDPPDPDVNRLDLTHLKVYTIDDESTQEIDDGISLEYLEGDRTKIWIHIADPTRWIRPGDRLDLDARKRSTTIYLPTGMVPMFPLELAAGPMSLVQGKVCPALSFGVVLSEAGAIETYEIHASSIVPTYRLTYEDASEAIQLQVQAEAELTALARWADRRRTWRKQQGAIQIHMPEASIKVVGEEVHISLVDDSVSRYTVAEMMILTGEIAARYAEENELPVPFRHQPQPELPPEEELLQLPAGPVRDCAMRRCMPRSEVSVTPQRHASLGLDRYAQATSPIRRYSDLLVHFQIKAHLRGEELPFSVQEVQEIMAGVATAAYEAVLVERQTNRYWSLEYLRRREGEVWQALVLRWLREDDRLGLILLEEIGMEAAMRFHRAVRPGDRIDVKVTYSDPRQDLLHFQETAPSTAASAAAG